MRRLYQFVLVGTFLPLCWLGMMAVHEFGHGLGALLTGGTVAKVVLHPLPISRTDLSSNPHPLLVVWAGPVLGVLLPLAGFGIAAAARTEPSTGRLLNIGGDGGVLLGGRSRKPVK